MRPAYPPTNNTGFVGDNTNKGKKKPQNISKAVANRQGFFYFI